MEEETVWSWLVDGFGAASAAADNRTKLQQE